jgi:hypothetical protein
MKAKLKYVPLKIRATGFAERFAEKQRRTIAVPSLGGEGQDEGGR